MYPSLNLYLQTEQSRTKCWNTTFRQHPIFFQQWDSCLKNE